MIVRRQTKDQAITIAKKSGPKGRGFESRPRQCYFFTSVFAFWLGFQNCLLWQSTFYLGSCACNRKRTHSGQLSRNSFVRILLNCSTTTSSTLHCPFPKGLPQNSSRSNSIRAARLIQTCQTNAKSRLKHGLCSGGSYEFRFHPIRMLWIQTDWDDLHKYVTV